MLGLVCLVWVGSSRRAEAQLGALISPGQLAKAHASLEGISNCQKCHEQGKRVTAQKCLVCHTAVADRIARRMGIHRNVGADCTTCHAEHGGADGSLRPFNQKAFDHASVTGFPLTGKHAPLATQCGACHKSRSFLSAKSACVSCHADIHKGALGSSCTSCHSTQIAFKDAGARFDHAKAAFQLAGAHTKVACASCHVNNTFKGVKFAACTDCHRDPHRQAFGTSCTACHTDTTWSTNKVAHAKTSFPLIARHATVDCVACHKQPAMKTKLKADTCAACHTDVHQGAFQQDCKACHSESGFAKAPFNHGRTRFLLTGQHEGLACDTCHKNLAAPASGPPRMTSSRTVDFRGLRTTCVSCHADVHQASLGSACESCHTSTTFRVTAFVHPRRPDFFAGQHAAVACDKCHMPAAPTRPARTGATVLDVQFRDLPMTCVSCHRDVHLGQEGTACETCHNVQTAKLAVPAFSHTRTSFALTGRHEGLACVACHKQETGVFPAGAGTAVRLKGVARECRGCHADEHQGQLDSTCESCHKTDSFKLPGYRHRSPAMAGFLVGRHARAACEACHKPFAGQSAAGPATAIRFKVETRCVACHVDVHRGGLGPNCGDCHRP